MSIRSICLVALSSLLGLPLFATQTTYPPSTSPHAIYSFNPGWKFIRQDVTNAEQVAFNDSSWTDVSTPHTYNDVDSYTALISHSGGDRKPYAGIAWYRKHFKLPASARDGKVFLEFEGLKQAGRFWVNGRPVGKYENGVTPFGLDLTGLVQFGDADNVIAVKVDNSTDYREEATGTEYEWMGRAFNPNYGGLNHDIWLHLTGKVYQTLPLYENLKTTGIYVYPTDISVAGRSCTVNVESQVRNESGDQQSITLMVSVVDTNGNICAHFQSDPSDLVNTETEIFKAGGILTNALFWSDLQPALYDVYCTLTVNDKVVDVQKVTTGFRKTEFKGGAGTGGVYINDRFTWLTGYSQRSSDDWAGLGEAYPDWMHDFNAQLMQSTHANYIRWMHISPQAVDVRACDQAGIIEVCPAGDKEGDPAYDTRLTPANADRQWQQRADVMRDAMIYFRNSPSILFWEAGNSVVSVDHMQQIVDLRKRLDPNGGRVAGTRDNDQVALNNAVTPVAEYYGVMMGQAARTDQIQKPGEIYRGYSVDRRDLAPLIETEDFRDEAARRFWDDYTPPHFVFKKGPDDTYSWNSESFCLAAAERYYAYVSNMISNTNAAHSKWSGYASIYWSDSNADGRQGSSEVARVSGKVDSVRLPKEAYFVYRVMQSATPDIHIIGHWNYPGKTVKDVYVAANHCDAVELFLNGKTQGKVTVPTNGYIYRFQNIVFAPGELSAVGSTAGGTYNDVVRTAGEPKSLKLTPHTGSSGLLADGSDVAFYDVEVVDAQGRRCPTDEGRVNFKLEGPAIWRGGYNSGKLNSINNTWLDTECGINRVAIRSTLTPGKITLTATRKGLQSASVTIESQPIALADVSGMETIIKPPGIQTRASQPAPAQ